MGARADSWPPEGRGAPGADLLFLREQLLDAWHIDVAILNALGAAGRERNLEYAAVLAAATNDWLQAEWLDPEPRLRASIVVPTEAPDLAAAEIRRCARRKAFVQVILNVRSSEPLGRRRYWPLLEAAAENDLPVGIHFGGAGGGPFTGAGWPSFYIEDHAGMAAVFQTQVTSLVCKGVFERFPALRVVLIEGGFAWLPPLIWRLDNAWRAMRDELPHLRRPPSEYIRGRFWLTTQPVEEPPRPVHFHQLLSHLGMSDRLLFATDYPHWDFDAPDSALPARLDPQTKAAIMGGNARQLYRL
jgi:hypothetical protein